MLEEEDSRKRIRSLTLTPIEERDVRREKKLTNIYEIMQSIDKKMNAKKGIK